MIVTWTKRNNLRLHVLDVYENNGEAWLTVCKEGADPIMGRFGVRAADTSAIDLLVI
jgi:hypothetical protein